MQSVHKAYGHLCESWQQRKQQLDQGIQLRMFETDCQKVRFVLVFLFHSLEKLILTKMNHNQQMFDWMYQSREEFLLNYFDIGNTHGTSKELQEDHKHFSLSSMVIDISMIIIILSLLM